jgi:hypothetical protein
LEAESPVEGGLQGKDMSDIGLAEHLWSERAGGDQEQDPRTVLQDHLDWMGRVS